MGKAAIQAQIDAKRGEITDLNSQISRLEGCKKALTDFSTDIEYVLTSNDNIETTYYLAGTPYLNETNNEEKILKTAKQKLSAKSDDVVAKTITFCFPLAMCFTKAVICSSLSVR